MKLNLNIKQAQRLSPQMIQSAQILQMTAQELNQYINELALENPVIDMTEPELPEENHYLHHRQRGSENSLQDKWNYIVDEGETLQNYLWSQLVLESLSSLEKEIIIFMLESLDERGYLTESVYDISVYFGAEESLVERLLEKMQTLEPAGVCARSIEECLKLQLKNRQMLSPALSRMIDECLEMVAKNKILSLSRVLRLSPSEAEGYCQIIKSLNPKPGTSFGSRQDMRYIIPDVIIVKFKDYFDILMNDFSCGQVEINQYYSNLSQGADSEEVREYLEVKIRQAEWIRQCIRQRKRNMMQVAKKILEYQESFFSNGPNYLSPLKMSQVAEAIGVHESTVSRTVSKKYLQCSWGVYPMSFFFPRNAGKEKEPLTNSHIKGILQNMISQEDKKKPYSDRLLSEKLLEQGISISRRTVAKYREEEKIPDAGGRRDYS